MLIAKVNTYKAYDNAYVVQNVEEYFKAHQ